MSLKPRISRNRHTSASLVGTWHSHLRPLPQTGDSLSTVQLLSHVRLFATPWTAAHQAYLSITNSQSLPKLMSIELVMPSNHLILSSPSTALNLSQLQGLFQWVSSSHQVAKVLEFPASTSVLPMNTQDCSPLGWTGWISLHSKGLSKSLLQHHSSKESILQSSAFFTVQLSHPYMTTGKTIALTKWTFVGKAMFLLLNMLSRLVITFLPRSKHLLISWLQSLSAVILEPQKIKSATVSPSIYHEVMELDAMILVFWMLSLKPTFFTLLFHFHQEAL